MTEADQNLVLPNGQPYRRRQKPYDGSCPGCGASRDKFKPVMTGEEVCMVCGYTENGETDG